MILKRFKGYNDNSIDNRNQNSKNNIDLKSDQKYGIYKKHNLNNLTQDKPDIKTSSILDIAFTKNKNISK